jgi:hypothetical protein
MLGGFCVLGGLVGEEIFERMNTLQEFLYLSGEVVETGLQVGTGYGGGFGLGDLDADLGGVGCAAEKVGEAILAGSGLAGKHDGERAGGGGVGGGWVRLSGAGGQAFECGLDLGEVVKLEEAVGAAAELAGGLRSAEEEQAKDGGFVAAEVEDGAGAVLVLGNAGVANWVDEGEVFEGVEGLADLLFGEVEDGIAAGTLVAGVDEGVKGERVVLRRGDLLLDEGAENAKLCGIESHGMRIRQGVGDGVQGDCEEHDV